MRPLVLVIQNEIDDPVALVGEWISEVGVDVEVIHAYRGETVPASLPAKYSGAITMGGYMGANDDIEFPYKLEKGYSKQFIALRLMKQKNCDDVFLKNCIKYL